MTMRPFTDVRGGLNHIVDAQIGRAFPVVHKVYQHLDAIEYVAQVYESGRSRDIVLRTNHTKEWIEWQYKGENTWTILFKFSDLLGADIADVVAAEQAIAAELVALRVHIDQARSDTLAASDRAQAAELEAVNAKNAAEEAQASAGTSAQEALASAVAAAQSAQGIHDVKDAAEVIAATVETYRDAVALSAQQAADSANNADSVKDFVVSARAEAEGFATTATTASTEAKAAQQAAESSAAAALTSENLASASALAAAASATTATEKLGEVSTLHDAAVTAGTTAAEAADTTTTHLAQVTALHSTAESFAQAAQASAAQADTAATAAGVSASDALQLRNETQGFHDAASAMVVDATQVSADRATVQTLAQEVQLAANQAQSNALAAADSADTAVASASAAAISATDAQTNADVVQGQVTAITGRLDEADSIVATVTALRDETLSYKLATQDSTVNAQAVAADRAAVTDMMRTIAADAASAVASATSAADSKDQALAAAATATQAEAAANTAVSVAQDAAQAVANNTSDAQSAATRAEEAATQAESAKQGAETAASTATTAAAGIAGQLEIVNTQATTVSGLHDQVQQLHDQTLAYKNTAQESVVNAQAVADDRAAVADMKVAVSADALAADTSRSQAEAAATAAAASRDQAATAAATAQESSQEAADNAAAIQLVADAVASSQTAAATSATEAAASASTATVKAGEAASSAASATAASTAVVATHEADANPHPQYQAELVSGTNLKTINGESLLGGGDLVVAGGGGGGGPTLQGDTAPYVTQTKTYQVTNYSSFSSYTVSVSAGTASISGDTITYIAPSTAGSADLTLTVDGQSTVFVITVQGAGVAQPTNISPTDGATGITDSPTLQSSAFAAYGLPDTHLASRWALYQGGVEVHSSGWRTDALTSYAVPAGVMLEFTAYTWTVEHQGNVLGDSAPSVATGFTTAASFNSYIQTPTPTPTNFGDPLEGGFYAGMVWGQIAQSSTSTAIGTGSKTFSVPNMVGAPIVYEGQQLEVRSRANPANKMVGTVTGATGTNLTINVTSVGGSGTFNDWSIMSRYRLIVAPKASGENAGVAIKNANTALPTACQTLAEGLRATQAMRDADTSTVYPAAHWARGLNIGGRADWYVPARDELELCWRNLKPVANNNYTSADRPTGASFNYANNGSYGDTANTHGLNNNSAPPGAAYTAGAPGQTAAPAFRTGGAEAFEFGSVYYWSSSEYSASYAWFQYWNSSGPGFQNSNYKTPAYRVRAVRRSVI